MLRVIIFFLESSWRIIVFAAITSSISAGLNLLVFRYLTLLVTEPTDDYWSQLGIICLMLVASVVISVFSGRYITKFYELRVANYRKELSEKVLKGIFQNTEKKLDRLVTVLLFEVSAVGTFGNTISSVIVALFQVVAVLIYLIHMSWQLSLMIVVIFSVSNLFNMYILPRLRKMEEEMSHTRYKLHFSLDRLEKGLKDLSVSSHHGEVYLENSVSLPSRDLAFLGLRLYKIKANVDGLMKIIQIAGIGLILVVSMHYLDMDQSLLVEYLALVLIINGPANTVFGFFKSVQNVQNALDQVEAFDVEFEGNEVVISEKLDEQTKSDEPLISVKDAVFSYGEKSNFTLGPASLDINENEIVIINGGNGSGKSTLFKIITGLYWPAQGATYYKGQVLSPENIQPYRDQFGCYFTDTPVFDDLTYLDKNLVNEKGNELIKRLQLEGKLKFDEIGHINIPGLSHGQRGRLNLLRLLLQDNQIYFFDEWAANQDFHFKEFFYMEIVPSLKAQGKTVILISHDDKFYHVADKVITLKNGQVISQ